MSGGATVAQDSPVSVAVPERPDLGWIKGKIPIEEVARELGLEVTRHRARCWRPENHRNGDADPSLRFHCRKNRARCFVCDQTGGFSTVDLVMGVLGCDFPLAVGWICERFPVPSANRGSPIGPRSRWRPNYRVGTSGTELELLVLSGLWALLTATQQKIVPVLRAFRDEETGWAQISYRGLMRYAGVGSATSIARAIRGFECLHALRVERTQAVGVVRGCSRYRLTFDDADFLRGLNEVYRRHREAIERERAFRAEARVSKNRRARDYPTGSEPIQGPRLRVAASGQVGGVASLRLKPPLSCTGKGLSPLSGAQANKPLHSSVARGVKALPAGGYEPPDEAELVRRAQEQKRALEHYLAAQTWPSDPGNAGRSPKPHLAGGCK